MSNELKSSGPDYGSICAAAPTGTERAGGPPLALGKGGSLPTAFPPHQQHHPDQPDNSFTYGVRFSQRKFVFSFVCDTVLHSESTRNSLLTVVNIIRFELCVAALAGFVR